MVQLGGGPDLRNTETKTEAGNTKEVRLGGEQTSGRKGTMELGSSARPACGSGEDQVCMW